ncbi:MAG: alpha/beta fold hydrolase, partial [Gemmatimonadetes bacterium]|nr:alpha/beta fold hydrolase [Gemmatimonadota bacterium]
MKLMTPIILLALLYLAVVAGTYFAQNRLLYFPDTAGPDRAKHLGLEPWPDHDSYLGFVSGTPPETPKGTFLVWHGNAGSALDRAYYTRALETRGYRVVLLEYPAYGTREGKLGEASFVADAERAAGLAAEQFGGALYALGESMGCGVASAVAANPDNRIEGVVLITPWASLPDLAQSLYWYLPAKWLTRDRYDNVRNLQMYGGPVAVAICSEDEVIPN